MTALMALCARWEGSLGGFQKTFHTQGHLNHGEYSEPERKLPSFQNDSWKYRALMILLYRNQYLFNMYRKGRREQSSVGVTVAGFIVRFCSLFTGIRDFRCHLLDFTFLLCERGIVRPGSRDCTWVEYANKDKSQHTPGLGHWVTVTVVVIVNIYLNHVCVDLGDQVMFTLQKHGLLILLLSFITLHCGCLLDCPH